MLPGLASGATSLPAGQPVSGEGFAPARSGPRCLSPLGVCRNVPPEDEHLPPREPPLSVSSRGFAPGSGLLPPHPLAGQAARSTGAARVSARAERKCQHEGDDGRAGGRSLSAATVWGGLRRLSPVVRATTCVTSGRAFCKTPLGPPWAASRSVETRRPGREPQRAG